MMEYSLSHDAYIEYITVTKGNKDLPFELAELKLNRNIKHGHLIHADTYALKYRYGTLCIETLFGEITSVYQAKKWMRINKYEELHT